MLTPYDIVVPPPLAAALGALAPLFHEDILQRLDCAARAAVLPRRAETVGRAAVGLHRGLHRANAGSHWLLYRVDHARHAIWLINFGDRRPAQCTSEESSWENEGGHQCR